MSVPLLEAGFPNLTKSGYSITSPATKQYNCIAWAAGKDNLWLWPDPPPYAYWPEEPRELSLASFLRVFHSFGYERCEDAIYEEGYEKVALYLKDSLPTHMARQLPSGLWTSKCGKLEDISHTLDGLENSIYGEVAVILKRPK